MKHHLLALGGLAQDYSAGLVTVPVISDILIRTVNNIIQLSDDWQVFAARLAGTGLTRFRISSAQSRIRGYPNLDPMSATVLPGDLPAFSDLRDQPIQLYNGENVTLQATNAGAQTTIGMLMLTRDALNFNQPPNNLRWCSFTCAGTGTVNTWSQPMNVVLDDDLEAGWYAVYGLRFYEATTYFARLVFKDQVERPGCIANQSRTQRPFDTFVAGFGMYGKFQSITPPFIEVVANAAAALTTPTGQLLMAKVG
jgi:hypothetical protein